MSDPDLRLASPSLVDLLDSATFKPFVQSHSVVLLSVVILPLSRRSQLLVPEFQNAAYIMQDSTIPFAQIDAIESGDVTRSFGISSYPQIILFRGIDNLTWYHGVFKESSIVSWLNRWISFPTLSRISKLSLLELKACVDVLVVAYTEVDDIEIETSFTSLAEAGHPEFIFGITDDQYLADMEQIAVPGIAVYKNFNNVKETVRLSFTGSTEVLLLSIRRAAQPLIIDLVAELHGDFLDMGLPLGYVFANTSRERDQIRKAIEPYARKSLRKIRFGLVDPIVFEDTIDDLHLDGTVLPAFAIREPRGNLRFPMSRQSDAAFEQTLQRFLHDWIENRLKPTVKSEPLPDKQTPLVKVVALNYDDIVMDPEKDVLITNCITPCGPCEALRPTLDAIAQLYDSSPILRSKITICIIAYDENDTPDLQPVRAFPTIRLYPASKKNEPILYLGDRDIDDIADFIRDHGTHKADLREGNKEVDFVS